MPAASATVTAKTGPANQVTALPMTGVGTLSIDFKKMVITLDAKEFDLTGVTTLTIATPGTTPVIVVS